MKISPQLAQYQRRKKEFIELLGGVCVDCGTNQNLEFDHDDRSQKKFTITKFYSKNYDDLKIEVLKCKLRCTTCHKIKTQTVDGIKATHGSAGMYRHQKCRCDLCKQGNTERHAAWRKRRTMA